MVLTIRLVTGESVMTGHTVADGKRAITAEQFGQFVIRMRDLEARVLSGGVNFEQVMEDLQRVGEKKPPRFPVWVQAQAGRLAAHDSTTSFSGWLDRANIPVCARHLKSLNRSGTHVYRPPQVVDIVMVTPAMLGMHGHHLLRPQIFSEAGKRGLGLLEPEVVVDMLVNNMPNPLTSPDTIYVAMSPLDDGVALVLDKNERLEWGVDYITSDVNFGFTADTRFIFCQK